MNEYASKLTLKDGCLHQRIAEYELSSPKMVVRDKFLNGDVKKKADQKFTYTVIPTADQWNAMPEEEREVWEDQEWDRRDNGVWFMNNGQPTWITGVHYYFLNYYYIKGVKPEYRDADRTFFWVWDYCVKQPKCMGLLYITRRQQGKSFRGGCIALEYATRTRNKHIGIQSKTEDDAQDLFKRAIVESWMKLPAYFSPKFSNTNSMDIKALRFEAAATRGRAARREGGGVFTEAGLNTWIDFESSKANAYDGDPYMGFYLHDEIFKKQDHNPLKRWSIVKKIFKQQGKVIAKSFHTSSVGEEIEEDGVARAESMWRDSNPNKLLDNKETKSGLFRLFQPAYIGYMWDEYGMDKVEESMNEFLSTRKGFEEAKEWDNLLGEKRANPFVVEEALLPEGDSGVYNNMILADTVDKINGFIRISGEGDWPRRYRLEWVDPILKDRVRAVEDSKNGRFLFSWFPPDEGLLNRVRAIGPTYTQYGLQTMYAPLNDINFGVGIDPVDHRAVKDEARASKLAANGMWKLDPTNEVNKDREGYWPSGSFIFSYAERVHIHTMYEDMIMACHLLGCSMLYENQKPGIENYFINRGYKLFLAGWDGSEKNEKYGISASKETIGKYVEIKGKWIEGTYDGDPNSLLADWRRNPFKEVLNQDMHFDANNTKKFDLSVSSSYTLMHCNRYMPVAPPPQEVQEFNFYYN